MTTQPPPAIDIDQLRELVRSELFTAAAGDAFEALLQELEELRAMRVAVHGLALYALERDYPLPPSVNFNLNEIERLTR